MKQVGRRSNDGAQLHAGHPRHVMIHDGDLERSLEHRGFDQLGERAVSRGSRRYLNAPRDELTLEDLSIDRVVVDDETAKPGDSMLGCAALGGGFEGQLEPEAAAFALYAGEANRTAHQERQSPADGEPQPCAAKLAGGRGVGLNELPEQ